MKRSRVGGLGLAGMVLGLIVLAMPPAVGQASAVSDRDCTALEAYRAALARPEVRTASRTEIRRQLRANPPVALLEGYWVSPVDLHHVLEVAAGLEPDGTHRLVAFAFTTGWLRDRIPLPYVGDFHGHGAPGAGASPPEIVLVPVREPSDIVLEYLPPPPGPGETECYYFCGDPAQWDFDGDGTVNSADPDDDDDGVPDRRDAYPYWPPKSSCDCGERDFVGFMEKFSSQITELVLAAHDRLGRGVDEEPAVSLAAVGDDQAAIRLLLPDGGDRCRQEDLGCLDASAPGVRYVSKDPEACAIIRYTCEKGSLGFSNACGCGCVRSEK
ncbi:MAG: hypothetical protein OER90_08245 [Gemmatimonadota bacterium]|nr:hypothetical protein [Gemmatimonadota bacterium]